MKKYAMSDIYWAEECCDNTPERAEIFDKSNESKDELQFYFADEADSVIDALKQRIKELEANQPKWISVKDKLPEEGVSVLCSNGYGVMFISSYNKNLMHFVSSGDFDWVTHWMPLPSAPKSED